MLTPSERIEFPFRKKERGQRMAKREKVREGALLLISGKKVVARKKKWGRPASREFSKPGETQRDTFSKGIQPDRE